MKQTWQHLRAWVNNHRIPVLIGSGILLIIVALGIVAIAFSQASVPEPVTTSIKKKVTPPKETYTLPLTGLKTTNQSDLVAPVTAVMLENSPAARPQSGLKDAEIVYEAVAEGGITRFVTIYQKNKPELIGPVRSVRPYYVEWYKPYDASMAHIGGSQKALQEIRNGTYRDLDQFFNAGTFWRATDRSAPHNVYTSFEKLDALNTQKGYTSSKPLTFPRGDTLNPNAVDATDISVTISSPLFNSSYRYDSATKLYTRSQGGAEHTDREKGTITPAVVIVMKVNEHTVQEETARQSITTTGEGPVTIFQQGKIIEGTWHRNSTSDQLQFSDQTGQTITLARGQTWITAINSIRGSVTWK